jgi:TRAP-type mannitol/chloroaromatic compound transport system substrate-binding protein
MERRSFLKTAGGSLAAAGLATPALAQSTPTVRWRLTSHAPKSLDAIFGSIEYFARRVSEITEGNFQIQVFAAGEIVPALQGLDAASNGTVEACQTASFYSVGKNPAFVFGTGLPFGPNPRGITAWNYFAGGMDLQNEFYHKFNVHGMPVGNMGCQMGGWFRREINKPEDLAGLKFRIGGLAGEVFSKLGVVPQQIPGADVYPALERGTIDAAEWIGPYDDEKLGFSQVAPYYYYPGWWEGGSLIHLFINLDAWNSLPKHYQEAVNIAAEAATQWLLAFYDAKNTAALRKLAGSGVQFRPFPPEVMEACFKAATELYSEIAAKNEDFRGMLESVDKFRNEFYLNYQLADYTFDTFQIRNRERSLMSPA